MYGTVSWVWEIYIKVRDTRRGQSRLVNPETQAYSIGHKTQNKNKENKKINSKNKNDKQPGPLQEMKV